MKTALNVAAVLVSGTVGGIVIVFLLYVFAKVAVGR